MGTRGNSFSTEGVYKLFTDRLFKEKILRETGVISFRVNVLAKTYYGVVLSTLEKETLKRLVEAYIIGVAKHKGAPVPPELERRIQADLTLNLASESPGSPIVFNIIVNENKAEANVTVNAKASELEDIIKLLEYLWNIASGNLPLQSKRVLAARVQRALNTLGELKTQLAQN